MLGSCGFTTLRFDELPFQPVNGLIFRGAIFSFRVDGVASTDIVPFRDLFLLIFPVTFTLKPFLGKKGHSAQEVDKMHAAWIKSCLFQVTLWSHPYVNAGDF